MSSITTNTSVVMTGRTAVIQTAPTSGYIQACVELRLIFAAELSAECLKGGFSLPESRLQTVDSLHMLLC